MQLSSSLLILVPFFLFVHGQEEVQEPESKFSIKKGLGKVFSTINSHVMPHVEGRATKLKTIINDHKEPLNEHLQDLRGKVNSHIMDLGMSVVEKGLDAAEILQNMTKRIKSEVLSFKPPDNEE